ncbi:hypothetical protein AB0N09_05095 [Streptomyces erythrochromogenes]|uniref:hypothetical protein n=1 Tax=Streptomyces erythrochromogenes TaxID=285574 RepID=UPI00343BEDFD
MAKTTNPTTSTGAVLVGTARRPGTEPPYADGADYQRRGDRVTAAVVDSAGHSEEAVRYAATVPAVITQVGMVQGGLAGLTTAGMMAQAYDAVPHTSAVYVSMEPGRTTAVYWIGDARVYCVNDGEVTLVTTDMTMGNYLRTRRGFTEDLAAVYDDCSRLGLAQAGWGTCSVTEIPEDHLVLLVSDGVPDHVDRATMTELCRTHADDPQALADALVAAAAQNADGYRDDCTVIAMRHRT